MQETQSNISCLISNIVYFVGTTELQWDILSIMLQEKCFICDNADDDESMV